ncbi:MAG: thiamine phosphate synthase, partial [Clostridiales bacterium]|nr:thiamine phosphate synthase [Clostridiales bacterium]
IQGGCSLVQLREKDCSSLEFYRTALAVKAVTCRHGVPLIINDRADIALAVDADGVHVGQSDLPCGVLRRMLGGEKVIGVSVSTLAEALQAERDGADYLGVGAMYATGTKSEAAIVSMAELRAIREAVKIPIVVIGGINQKTAPAFRGMGIDGLAVVSAVIAQPDIAQAARTLLNIFREGTA